MKTIFSLVIYILPILLFSQKKDSIYAFIGKVIESNKVDYKEHYDLKDKITNYSLQIGDTKNDYQLIDKAPILMDEMYVTKVKVIKWLNNDIKKDIIEFVSFDHYGKPDFLSVEYPILYLGFNKKKKEFYQYKYQFDIAYKIKEKWLGIYQFRDLYITKYLANVKTVSVNIPYNLPEKFNIDNEEQREKYFPRDFYDIKSNREAFIRKLYKVEDLANVRMNSLTLR
ncbi:hypothetical protein ACTS9T_12550 [Empedobacter falsenii]|uniref:hypothetical protein n=1 Tax=Empedobacter sp. GD03797 TaxID=2975382 RepID=UPI002446AD71|nr:hypothetical protein [Empedobacter sp. GD03797]MDH1881142.1 hypothetical protein [Empedobacter sp. GD03797]